MLTSKLAFGPMSEEIIEAVYRYSSSKYSSKTLVQLMLIASRNQVDYDHGYVFKTKEYATFLDKMYKRYPEADIKICRDHCGLGFSKRKDDDLKSVFKTIENDIENGFDLIHIDLCHLDASLKRKLCCSKKLMTFAKDLNKNILFEVGTDENIGIPENNPKKIIENINYFLDSVNLEFYVAQTGSLIKEMYNVGTFVKYLVKDISDVLHNKGIKLKEHNADYLCKENIQERIDSNVDALNIAPQLGVIQTNCVLAQCQIYGIEYRDFLYIVHQGRRWEKWTSEKENLYFQTILAGHYHYKSPEYQKIITALNKYVDIKEKIIGQVTDCIRHYDSCFRGVNE